MKLLIDAGDLLILRTAARSYLMDPTNPNVPAVKLAIKAAEEAEADARDAAVARFNATRAPKIVIDNTVTR